MWRSSNYLLLFRDAEVLLKSGCSDLQTLLAFFGKSPLFGRILFFIQHEGIQVRKIHANKLVTNFTNSWLDIDVAAGFICRGKNVSPQLSTSVFWWTHSWFYQHVNLAYLPVYVI